MITNVDREQVDERADEGLCRLGISRGGGSRRSRGRVAAASRRLPAISRARSSGRCCTAVRAARRSSVGVVVASTSDRARLRCRSPARQRRRRRRCRVPRDGRSRRAKPFPSQRRLPVAGGRDEQDDARFRFVQKLRQPRALDDVALPDAVSSLPCPLVPSRLRADAWPVLRTLRRPLTIVNGAATAEKGTPAPGAMRRARVAVSPPRRPRPVRARGRGGLLPSES